MPRSKLSIGQILTKSLTLEQIASLLTVISALTDLNMYIEEFEKKDPDMATTVKKILTIKKDSASRGKIKPLASLQRTMEHWRSLWRNWEDVLSEVGDEDGKYAVQDHHWEPPYFDGWSLASDLEPIAEDMLSLIEDVYDEVDNPDLFSEALEEIDDQIGSYPEWMGAEHGEPCPVAYAFSRREDPDDAIRDLRFREGTTLGNVGFCFLNGNRTQAKKEDALKRIQDWAMEKEIDVVVWTDLESNFQEKSEGRRPFSVNAALDHIQALDKEGQTAAMEYVSRAPAFVKTPLQEALESQPWFG